MGEVSGELGRGGGVGVDGGGGVDKGDMEVEEMNTCMASLGEEVNGILDGGVGKVLGGGGDGGVDSMEVVESGSKV